MPNTRWFVTDDAEDRDEDRPGREAPERHRLARARRERLDDPGVVEADEGDEEADPDRDRLLQLEGDRPEDQLAQAAHGEQHHGDSLEHDEAHRLGEARLAARDEAVGDDRVQAHARRDRVGVVRRQPHEDRHHACDETGARQDRPEHERLPEGRMRHPREDDRVDEDDVRHHDERRDTGHRVLRERRSSRCKAEVALEESLSPRRRGDRAHLVCVLPWTRDRPVTRS